MNDCVFASAFALENVSVSGDWMLALRLLEHLRVLLPVMLRTMLLLLLDVATAKVVVVGGAVWCL